MYKIFFILLIISGSASAVDPRLDWKTIESKNFYIHYANGYELLAQKAANSAEHAHLKLQPLINWQPLDKTHLVLSDETDSPNGYAVPINFNRSVLFVSPPDSANSLEDFNDWLDILITHEYTHILHLDKVAAAPEFLRNIVGRHYLLFPNLYQPAWLIEGLATYYETDRQLGIGRGQSSIYKMMMREEISNGIKSVNQVNLPLRSWPMGTTNYLYGVHYYQFIEEVYGKESLALLLDNYSKHLIPFAINTNAQQVLDKDLNELWIEFSDWLDKKYKGEIDAIGVSNKVEGVRLTQSGYSTGPIDISEKGELFYISNGAFEHSALVQGYQKSKKILSDLNPGAKLDLHKSAGILIVQDEFCDEYNINKDLYVYKNKSLKKLTQCGRYRSAVWAEQGTEILAVKISKGVSQLIKLNAEGEIIKVLWTGNSTDIVAQLRMSPSEPKLVAAVFRQDAGWNIEEFDLTAKKWKAITHDRDIDMYPSYSDDGRSIIFSSERSGRYQIYRYRKNSQTHSQQLEQLTQVVSGAFSARQLNQESPLYYVGYTANGNDVFKLEQPDILQKIALKNQSVEQYKARETVSVSATQSYSALSSLAPRWWFPILNFNKDQKNVGFITAGNDALGIHNYFTSLAYDSSYNFFTGSLNYSYAQKYSMGIQRYASIYKDENGDFAALQKTEDVFMSYAFNFLAIETRINTIFGGVVSETSDVVLAPGIAPVADSQDNLLGAALLYSNENNYVRSISPADGRRVRFLAESSEFFASDFSGEIYTLDWREYIALGKQQVLAFRWVQGWATDVPKLFRLGGEENLLNVLDIIFPASESLFGKRNYSLRGYGEGLPQLTGRRMQMASLEWRFPGDLTEFGLMFPPVGLVQWSGSLFAESGTAYNSSSPEKYYSTIGIELQGDINLLYGLNSRVRLGFASGLDKEIGENRIYLSLGSSF